MNNAVSLSGTLPHTYYSVRGALEKHWSWPHIKQILLSASVSAHAFMIPFHKQSQPCPQVQIFDSDHFVTLEMGTLTCCYFNKYNLHTNSTTNTGEQNNFSVLHTHNQEDKSQFRSKKTDQGSRKKVSDFGHWVFSPKEFEYKITYLYLTFSHFQRHLFLWCILTYMTRL